MPNLLHLTPTQLLRDPLHPPLINPKPLTLIPLDAQAAPGQDTTLPPDIRLTWPGPRRGPRRPLLQQRRHRRGRLAVPDIHARPRVRLPLFLRVVEDAIDLDGQLGLGGDEGAGVHVEGVEGVEARGRSRFVVGRRVRDLDGVGARRGRQGGMGAGGGEHDGRGRGRGEAVVEAGRLVHQACAFGLAEGGFQDYGLRRRHFAVVEFEEAGAQVRASEGGHAGFVLFLRGELGEGFAAGSLLGGDGTREVLRRWFVGLVAGEDLSRDGEDAFGSSGRDEVGLVAIRDVDVVGRLGWDCASD